MLWRRGAILIAGSRCGLCQHLTSFDLHFKKAQGQVQAPDKQTWFHGADGAKLHWQDSAATWSSAWPSPGACSSWFPFTFYPHLRELPWLERANTKLSKQSLVPPAPHVLNVIAVQRLLQRLLWGKTSLFSAAPMNSYRFWVFFVCLQTN